MARKHMKPFNVARGYCHKIEDFPIPHGCFYGRDSVSYWYCINKELYPLDTPTLEIYRLNPADGEWYLLIEQSETVKMIAEKATPEDWKMPIEYPKYKGIHSITSGIKMVSKSYQTIPGKTCFQEMQKIHENRHNTVINQPQDIWESVAPMTYEEKCGKKTIKRPRWKKTQYTLESKPYIVHNAHVCS